RPARAWLCGLPGGEQLPAAHAQGGAVDPPGLPPGVQRRPPDLGQRQHARVEAAEPGRAAGAGGHDTHLQRALARDGATLRAASGPAAVTLASPPLAGDPLAVHHQLHGAGLPADRLRAGHPHARPAQRLRPLQPGRGRRRRAGSGQRDPLTRRLRAGRQRLEDHPHRRLPLPPPQEPPLLRAGGGGTVPCPGHRHHHHGAAGHVQRAPPRGHQLCRHPPVRPDLLRVRLRASNFYRKLGGQCWVWNILLTSSLFSGPFFLTWSVINTVHWVNGSTQALPATTVLLLLTVWLLVASRSPSSAASWARTAPPASTPRAAPRTSPARSHRSPGTRGALVHMTIGGFLPFSAISVELYYIFATVWGREQYTLYGVLFIVFAILLSVSGCISVALTYFQLSGEDHRWWWRSIFSTGSTGLFMFLYSIFYYHRRSNMSGALQTLEFFGYTFLTCYTFFLMLGSVSFFTSLQFIRYIYVNLKMD
ncbi:transmembrane 9 superfamily member 1-like, partial [Rhinoraja longicauda]